MLSYFDGQQVVQSVICIHINAMLSFRICRGKKKKEKEKEMKLLDTSTIFRGNQQRKWFFDK